MGGYLNFGRFGGEILEQDHYVFFNSGTNTLLYKSFDPNSGTLTNIGSTVSIAAGAVVSDGTFVFVGRGSQATQQYRWTGSAFSSVFGPSTPSGLTNTAESLLFDPSQSNRLIYSAVDSFAANVALVGYQASATFSFTNHNEAGSPASGNRWREVLFDVRKTGEEGQHGSLFLSMPGFDGTGYDVFAFDTNGSAISVGTEAVHETNNAVMYACDRDAGVAVILVSGTTVRSYSVNKSTKACSYLGQGSVSVAPYCMAMTNGVLVTADSGGNFRTYTRSGGTYTAASTLAIGNTNTVGRMYVSPRNNLVYFGNASGSHCLQIGEDGSIESLGGAGIGAQVADSAGTQFAFVPGGALAET